MGNHTNIPNLRFPEFTGEWEVKKLGDAAEKIQDGTHFSPQTQENGEFMYVTSKNVKNGYLDISNIQYISKIDHFNIYKRCDVKKGDVLITKDGTIGQVCVNELEQQFSLLSSVAFVRTNDNHSNYFLYQILVSPIGQKEIESQIAGQALKRITLTKINNFEYSFPTLTEQTKIANFLTTVDEKIQSLKKKNDLLEQYKKGVMQKLFSQELRFKDESGKDFPDWEVKKLGEVYSFLITNSLSRENLNYENGTVKNIHYGDIHTKFSTLFDVTKEEVPFINQEVNLNRIATENYCKVGDVVFADASEDLNDVGKSIEIINLNGEKLLSGLHTLLARPLHSKLSIGFGGYMFKSEGMRLQIQKEAQGSKVLSISATRLTNIDLSMPSLPEQTRITNFLIALDKKISETNALLEQTELWKKGLLQRMFC